MQGEIVVMVVDRFSGLCYNMNHELGTFPLLEAGGLADIWDVAKLAGVSKSTVSRVVTSSGSVKPATRELVEKAMAELNYTPSYFAQGIRTGKTRTIAFVYPDSSNIFYNELIAAVEDVALESGYMVLTCNTRRSKKRELEYISELVKRNIEGVIFCTYFYDPEHLEYLLSLSRKLPMVFMDHVFENRDDVSMVITEDVKSNCNVVKYLAGKGSKRIAYLWLEDVTVVKSRYQGYLSGLEACGLPFDERLVFSARFEESRKNNTHIQLGYEGMKALMALPEPPDAVMASIDILAIGAIQYLQQIKVPIPECIRVAGYDNIEMAQLIKPTLSTISQPIQALGHEATNILLKKINEGNDFNRSMILDPEFIVREST